MSEHVLTRIGNGTGFITLDRDFRYVALNELACASMGTSRDAILGRRIWDFYPDTIGTPFETELRRALAEQETRVFEYFYPARDRWYENRIYPSKNGLSIFFTDITERKKADEDRTRLLALMEPDVAVLDMQIGKMGGIAVSLDLRLEASAGRIPDVAILLLLDREVDRFLETIRAA